MDSLSLATSTVESTQGHSGQPLLACVRFLNLHSEHGGLNQKEFNMLYRIIQMTSAIGWEVHVTFSSKIPWVRSMEKMQCYIDCILQGCEVFRKNMAAFVKNAMNVSASLPDLDDNKQRIATNIKYWQQSLRYDLVLEASGPGTHKAVAAPYTSQLVTIDDCSSLS